jgi:glutamate N-acetyltransferase/amino-acid N-acetyltransferase
MSVTAPAGFAASGVASGIKTGGALDVALVSARPPGSGEARAHGVPAAAVFTSNRAAAAPVQVSRDHLQRSGGRVAAVVLNSGCANAATGDTGMQAARRTCLAVAAELGVPPEEVLVCSTGLIGPQLAVERVERAVPALVAALGSRALDGAQAARAIMTTDTHPKEAVAKREGWSVGGMVKGAGMIAPRMVPLEAGAGAGAGGPAHATMLCVLTTDVSSDPAQLTEALVAAVDVSFNSLTVDGCTSTNDTVILLASGATGPVSTAELTAAVSEVCETLAGEMALDAEGTTRVARISVSGAASDADARRAARGVAQSLLVKTSLFGADPYWGRVVSELGASGAAFDLSTVRVGYGGVVVCAGGAAVEHDEAAVARHLAGRVVEIGCDLGLGDGHALVVTTDLGHGYINENMHTS